MNHSLDELLEIVYRYYPRGIGIIDPLDIQRRDETEEHARLVAARRHAGADCSRWLDMLKRLGDQFPERDISNLSVPLVLGRSDACYSGALSLPDDTADHWHHIDFRVSFLVPYYIVFSSRVFDDLEELERMKARLASPQDTVDLYFGDTMFVLPSAMVKPEFRKPPPLPKFRPRRRDISFDFSPDEQSYASQIAREIEATWRYERMPLEVGKVVVPSVEMHLREATLYDCLFADNDRLFEESDSGW